MIHVMHHSSDLTTRKISQPRCMKNVNFPSLISIPFSPVASVAHSVKADYQQPACIHPLANVMLSPFVLSPCGYHGLA